MTPDQLRRLRLRRMNLLMAYASFASARSAAPAAFTPASLFAAGEQGVWYDPSDLTTLFQDAAGTTPVTAVEQPVGLVLDKSRGLALGSEIITVAADRDFSSNTGYWSFNGGVGISGGALNWSATPDAYAAYTTSNAITTPGKYYEITWTITSISSGGLRVGVGSQYGVSRTAAGTYTERVLAGSVSNRIIIICVGTTTASVDNISVKEVLGSHASQTTAASRPVLSARKNLLVNTETLSTQNVTVRAVEHVLSFWGTGTITLSGASTAAPLVGTGAANRVYVAFTPTAGTLTLTVSGTVSKAQLEETREGA